MAQTDDRGQIWGSGSEQLTWPTSHLYWPDPPLPSGRPRTSTCEASARQSKFLFACPKHRGFPINETALLNCTLPCALDSACSKNVTPCWQLFWKTLQEVLQTCNSAMVSHCSNRPETEAERLSDTQTKAGRHANKVSPLASPRSGQFQPAS